MLAIARFNVVLGNAAHFEAELSVALEALSQCAGFVKGEIGQNLDDRVIVQLVTDDRQNENFWYEGDRI